MAHLSAPPAGAAFSLARGWTAGGAGAGGDGAGLMVLERVTEAESLGDVC